MGEMTEIRDDDFDWFGSASVVVHEQRSVAVYWNDNFEGAIVIREKAGDLEDCDHYIRIQPDKALNVARAILRVAGIEVAISRVADTVDTSQAPKQETFKLVAAE